LIFAGLYLQAQDIGMPLLYCIALIFIIAKRGKSHGGVDQVMEEELSVFIGPDRI
jgi:hypothetical protein